MTRSVPPVLRRPADPRLPPVRRQRLAGGLDVYLIERHDLPVVDVRLVVRAGAAHDDPRLAGRAYLTAALLDEGTASRSAMDIADAAEMLGASLHTRASWDYCAAALHVLTPRLQPALELLADIVVRPAFPEAELERKRTERLASILQERAEPRTLASEALVGVLYGQAHPFGVPLGGSRETVERITRQDILSFYHQRFSSRNAFLIIVGDFATARLRDSLDDLFGDWSATDPIPVPTLPPAPAAPSAIHIVDRPGASQSEIRVGHAGPPRHSPDYFSLQVGNTVLGGAFTSRLNMSLREEKAYTYGAGSSFAWRAGGGPFLASTAVFTDVTADAVATIMAEIGRMSVDRVPHAELERAQNYITLGLPRTFETTGDIAEHVSDVALHDLGADYHDRYAALIRAVTADDVQSAAARWMKRAELQVVIAGDASRIATDLETLGLGAVHVRESD